MPAEGRENHLLKKGNSDAFFREKYLTKNRFSDAGAVFPAGAACQLLHQGLLCTAGSDGRRDGGGGGLCAGAGLTGNSMEKQAGCHFAIRTAYGMMKVF